MSRPSSSKEKWLSYSRTTTNILSYYHILSILRGKAPLVTQLDVALQREQDVARFQVSVNDVVLMEVDEGLQSLLAHSSDLRLCQRSLQFCRRKAGNNALTWGKHPLWLIEVRWPQLYICILQHSWLMVGYSPPLNEKGVIIVRMNTGNILCLTLRYLAAPKEICNNV